MPIVIVDAETHQFFSSQCTAVRDENHRPVCETFHGDDVQNDPFPDLGRGEARVSVRACGRSHAAPYRRSAEHVHE